MPKSGEYFHFKQFSVRHDRCSMKVGTDGVLLGAWANVEGAKTILDIGTGSGVIALMLSQRSATDTTIDAVEPAADDALQAKENAAASPWVGKIHIHQLPIQLYVTDSRYDLIVSNPPYFNNSQKPPDERRVTTRHTTTLDYDTLLDSVNLLLTGEGVFDIILPYSEGLAFIALARSKKLYPGRQTAFRTRTGKPVERWLLEFTRHEVLSKEEEILLYKSGLEWSERYIELTRDFYLKA